VQVRLQFIFVPTFIHVHSDSMVIFCTSKTSLFRLSARRTLGYVTKKAGNNILEEDREVTYYSKFKVLWKLLEINS
jgi:hypothetical protein